MYWILIYYLIQSKIAIDLQSGAEVAIKFATKKLFHSLENEFINYLQLGADGKVHFFIYSSIYLSHAMSFLRLDPDIVEFGIPHLIHYGEFGGYTILVLTKTGPNLHDLRFQTTTDEFDLKTVYKIAIQAVSIFLSFDAEKSLNYPSFIISDKNFPIHSFERIAISRCQAGKYGCWE